MLWQDSAHKLLRVGLTGQEKLCIVGGWSKIPGASFSLSARSVVRVMHE